MTIKTSEYRFESLFAAVKAAGERIAPAWPLDQSIAVNPLWELRDQDIADVSARLGALGGVSCLMPGAYYQRLWQRSRIKDHHLVQAATESGLAGSDAGSAAVSVEALLQALKSPLPAEHWHNVSDWLDEDRDRQHNMAWRDEITHQISQFMASWLQVPEHDTREGLYLAWVAQIRRDRGIAILMGEPGLTRAFRELPDDPGAMILAALSELGVSDPEHAHLYAHSLLLDIHGWASRLAYERWQSRLGGGDGDVLPQLVAIRLGWELALWRHWQWRYPAAAKSLQARWYTQMPRAEALIARFRQAQSDLWVWQRAAELARQQEEQQLLSKRATTQSGSVTAQPKARLQAVFCIDVRSEVMRRALEAQSPQVSTHGYAGFFGLAAAYTPTGSCLSRPQLPGLLAPALRVTEGGYMAVDLGRVRAARSKSQVAWTDFSRGASTAFSMVEALGLGYAGKLLKRTFGTVNDAHPVNDLSTTGEWDLFDGERPLTHSEKAAIAGGMLKGLGLRRLAGTVLLVGHGSHTTNNPHAAGLDCGACGGQTGAVNVQVLAQLLNNAQVREILAAQGQRIPDSTRFVAALHNTTTDDIHCYGDIDAEIRQWLDDARLLAQRERAHGLGLADTPLFNKPEQLDREIRQRACDWSEVRPEWGLAGNSAFIVAPRSRTRGISFGGRAFLHDYDASLDSDNSVLEAIMTAPMVVTHWINMQYNASVTDPLKFGSGNKVLHNVVGGNLGVFEGNGGDLRIGLPWQSVHNGEHWMHEPLRLSVYIQAPQAAMSQIIERHQAVRDLVGHRWIYLFALNDDGTVSRWTPAGWQATDLKKTDGQETGND